MSSVSESLAQLAELRDKGVLTEAEFQQQKARLLGTLQPPATNAALLKGNAKSNVKSGNGCLTALGILVAVIFVLGIIGSMAGGSVNAVDGTSGTTEKSASKKNPDEAKSKAKDSSKSERVSGLTMANYNRLRNGMSYRQVIAIVGQPSQEVSRSEIAGYETVMYIWEGSWGANMNAMFQNGELVQKAQLGLK